MTPKEAAGRRAAEYIEADMIVGLGTGSTTEWAIRALWSARRGRAGSQGHSHFGSLGPPWPAPSTSY